MSWSAAATLAAGLLSQRSANKQMRFQDRSSRTQYQRAVADMKAAGLNPMLATKLGGNAAMSGAMATFPDIGATINSAENLRQMEPVRQAEAQKGQLANKITKAISLPKAEIQGAPFRFVSDLVRDIESFVKVAKQTNPVEIFTQDEINGLASALRSLERKSRRAFADVLNGLDATTTEVLEGFEAFTPIFNKVKRVFGVQ